MSEWPPPPPLCAPVDKIQSDQVQLWESPRQKLRDEGISPFSLEISSKVTGKQCRPDQRPQNAASDQDLHSLH